MWVCVFRRLGGVQVGGALRTVLRLRLPFSGVLALCCLSTDLCRPVDVIWRDVFLTVWDVVLHHIS